jgi:uncharacterized protein (DUF362 family)
MSHQLTRRAFLPVAGGAFAAGCGASKTTQVFAGKSAVAVVKAASYSVDLTSRILEGIRVLRLEVRGKHVLLKPNLVEFDRSTAINTDVSVIAAAYDVFRSLGAASVVIGEGPGHRRDTIGLSEEAGYREGIEGFDEHFVDLNRDDVSKSKGFADGVYLPNTALGADLIVSLAKMKTHHWAGATLSMKNFFGLVPGSVYGWPKNELHYYGIPKAIVQLNRIFRKTFAIVDGIAGMEGNGPIQGTPKHAGVLVMGSDLVAVDATCCRIMGIAPERVEYLRLAADLGAIDVAQIEQRGERLDAVKTSFKLIKEFEHLRLT